MFDVFVIDDSHKLSSKVTTRIVSQQAQIYAQIYGKAFNGIIIWKAFTGIETRFSIYNNGVSKYVSYSKEEIFNELSEEEKMIVIFNVDFMSA